MTNDVNVTVSSDEQAAELRKDFEELLARVNGDMMLVTMVADDPLSVEAAIVSTERSIEAHLKEFADNAVLQALRPEIEVRFRRAIEQQARAAGS